MSEDKQNILIVDDNADIRESMAAMVESLGHTPIVFGSGKAALGEIAGKNIALALLDIMMPEMGGYDLLAEIKKMPEYESLPIIMVTAKDRDSEIIEGYQYGADYYITKPFTIKQLEYGINLFLSGESGTKSEK